MNALVSTRVLVPAVVVLSIVGAAPIYTFQVSDYISLSAARMEAGEPRLPFDRVGSVAIWQTALNGGVLTIKSTGEVIATGFANAVHASASVLEALYNIVPSMCFPEPVITEWKARLGYVWGDGPRHAPNLFRLARIIEWEYPTMAWLVNDSPFANPLCVQVFYNNIMATVKFHLTFVEVSAGSDLLLARAVRFCRQTVTKSCGLGFSNENGWPLCEAAAPTEEQVRLVLNDISVARLRLCAVWLAAEARKLYGSVFGTNGRLGGVVLAAWAVFVLCARATIYSSRILFYDLRHLCKSIAKIFNIRKERVLWMNFIYGPHAKSMFRAVSRHRMQLCDRVLALSSLPDAAFVPSPPTAPASAVRSSSSESDAPIEVLALPEPSVVSEFAQAVGDVVINLSSPTSSTATEDVLLAGLAEFITEI